MLASNSRFLLLLLSLKIAIHDFTTNVKQERNEVPALPTEQRRQGG